MRECPALPKVKILFFLKSQPHSYVLESAIWEEYKGWTIVWECEHCNSVCYQPNLSDDRFMEELKIKTCPPLNRRNGIIFRQKAIDDAEKVAFRKNK